GNHDTVGKGLAFSDSTAIVRGSRPSQNQRRTGHPFSLFDPKGGPPGATVFVPAGMPHTYSAAAGARYLIVLTPRIAAFISALQADRDPARQHDIYRRFDSELLE